MKKNYLFGLLSLFTVLFMASCQEEDVFGGASDANTNVITYKVSTQQVATRAAVEAGQGAKANKLYYGVYELINNEWKLIETSSVLGKDQALAITAGTPCEVPIRLAKQKKYSVIFWAQSENEKPLCTVNWGARQMSINTDLLSNQESYDAFWGYDVVELNGAMSKNVDLKRPFAQLNIGTSDFADAVKASVDVVSSAVTVMGLPTTLNLETGDVVEAQNTHAYDLAAIPNATEYAFPVEPAKYQYLALNYVLVGREKSIIDVELSYKDSENQEYSSTFTAVPVQRNYRTNIYGTLLTNDANYTVDIKPVFTEPANELDALHMAAAVGGTVTLTQDITFTEPLVVSADMVLNLGNYSISNANGYVFENTGNLTINAENGGINGLGGIRSKGGKITINGGTYTGSSDWNNGTYQHVLKAENTEVVINGGTFDATIGGITNAMINVSNGSKVTIDGGEFRNVSDGVVIPTFPPYIFTYEGDGKLIINDGEFYGGWRFNGTTATTDIYGGNFTVGYDGQSFHANSTHVLTVYGGTFSLANGGKLNPTNYVASGYYVNNDGDNYIVGDFIFANTTEGLQAALDAATDGTTINLKAGVNYGVVYLGRPTKFNNTVMACGDEFETTDATAFVAHLSTGGWHPTPEYTTTLKDVTIVGAEGATIAGLLATSGHAYGDNVHDYVLDVDKNGSAYYNTLHMENVKFSNVAFTGKIDINTSDAASTYNGITFEGCTFTTGGTASSNGPAIRYYNEANNGNVKNIVVKNCKFNNCYQGVYVHHVNGITVTDNEFDTTGHNAIAIQGHDGEVDLKNVVIKNNTFKNIGDRIIRFNNVGADSNIIIQYNTATNSGDDSKEVIKATSIAEGVYTEISFNSWGEGAIVVNSQLKDTAAEATTQAELKAALDQPNIETIYLGAGKYVPSFYPGDVPARKSLTIVGSEGTQFAYTGSNYAGQFGLAGFDKVTIRNCEILRRETVKNWGMIVFGSSNNANGIYTIENCTFNGVGTQGIYINEQVSGATYNILNCTFNGDFGGEGAISIQNNDGVNHTVNVKGCTFNIPDTSHEIYIHYGYTGWTLIAEGVTPYWKAL